MYITITFHFGTNIDGKFTVPDFWPEPGQMYKILYEHEEIAKELEGLKARYWKI
jgi:protein PET100